MMKSKKKMKGKAKKAAKKKGKVTAKKTGFASVVRSHQRIEPIHDPPLTVSEIDRVKESRQNIRPLQVKSEMLFLQCHCFAKDSILC